MVQWCRPGTTDAIVLQDTFLQQYHLAPVELSGRCTIVDLGANVGYTMADYACRYPQARVIGVELDAGNAAVAALNVAGFGARCTVINGAAWHKDGKIAYDAHGEAWGFHVTEAESDVDPHFTTAPAFTLDTLFTRFGIEKVDFLKMDIEGAEANILDPSAAWLKQVQAIKVEVHDPYNPEKCKEVLAEAGFVCQRDSAHWACISGTRNGISS